MAKRLAVAVLHGMGRQAKPDPADTARRSFSAGLHRQLVVALGAATMARVDWHEVFWADVIEPRQVDYLRRAGPAVSRGPFRDFVINSLGDAASYRRTDVTSFNTTYQDVHLRMSLTLANLEDAAGAEAPVLIVAHSLGGFIASNYIWDMQAGHVTAPTPFRRCEQVAGIVTFGCNIPVFLFALPPERIAAIARPSAALPPALRLDPWWLNLHARADVLGYPLAPAGAGYAALAARGELEDRRIRAGGLLRSWNALSHFAYWTDRRFAVALGARIAALLGG